MDIITALNAARTLNNFIESELLVSLLSKINLTAAENALRDIKYANDKKQQIRHVITHLQGADAAITIPDINDKSVWENYKNSLDIHSVINNITTKIYIKSLLAICYKYVDEFNFMDIQLHYVDEYNKYREQWKYGASIGLYEQISIDNDSLPDTAVKILALTGTVIAEPWSILVSPKQFYKRIFEDLEFNVTEFEKLLSNYR